METLSGQILLTLSLNTAELSAFDLATEIFPYHWQIPGNLAAIRTACKSLQEQGRIFGQPKSTFMFGPVQVYTRTRKALALS